MKEGDHPRVPLLQEVVSWDLQGWEGLAVKRRLMEKEKKEGE